MYYAATKHISRPRDTELYPSFPRNRERFSPCSFSFCILSRCCAASFSYVTFSFASRFTTPVLILSVLIRGSDIIYAYVRPDASPLRDVEDGRGRSRGCASKDRRSPRFFLLFFFCLIRQGRVDRNGIVVDTATRRGYVPPRAPTSLRTVRPPDVRRRLDFDFGRGIVNLYRYSVAIFGLAAIAPCRAFTNFTDLQMQKSSLYCAAGYARLSLSRMMVEQTSDVGVRLCVIIGCFIP